MPFYANTIGRCLEAVFEFCVRPLRYKVFTMLEVLPDLEIQGSVTLDSSEQKLIQAERPELRPEDVIETAVAAFLEQLCNEANLREREQLGDKPWRDYVYIQDGEIKIGGIAAPQSTEPTERQAAERSA